MPRMTRAVLIHQPGDPPDLRITESPAEPDSSGHLRLALVAADVTPLDRQIAAGRLPIAGPFPLRPGTTAVGRPAPTGDHPDPHEGHVAVLGESSGMGIRRPGTFASEFLVDEQHTVALPAGLDPRVAAAGAGSGLVARLTLFDTAAVRPGEVVLVLGATGGVGSAAVQLATAHGARVLAAARNPEPGAGTPVHIDRLAEQVAAATDGRGVDVVIDCVGGPVLGTAIAVGAPNCRHVVVGYTAGTTAQLPITQLIASGYQLTGFNLFAVPAQRQRDAMRQTLGDLADGTLTPRIGAEYPLSQAADAYATASSTRGRTLLIGPHA